MIAQAGATFATLAVSPLVNPLQPSSFQISIIAENTLYLLEAFEAFEDDDDDDSKVTFDDDKLSTCLLVFATSKGVVTVAARIPELAPAINEFLQAIQRVESPFFSEISLDGDGDDSRDPLIDS